ncbi:MAG: EcsC family protein [Isosphaeraceae bacterium]
MADLTPYERVEIRSIADWKALRPSWLEEALGHLGGPALEAMGRIAPERLIRPALQYACDRSNPAATQFEIADMAGVADIRELAGRPLEVCDRLARKVAHREEAGLFTEMVAADFADLPGEVLELPVLLWTAIRLIRRIGHCYGDPMDGPGSRTEILGLLVLGHESDPGRRQAILELLDRKRSGNDPALEAKASALLMEDLEGELCEDAVLEFVPVAGAILAAYGQFQDFRHLAIDAWRYFQERHLRAQGKLAAIEPASVGRRASTVADLWAFATQAVYVTGIGLGFGAAFPVLAAARIAGRAGAAGRGLRDGSSHAVADARGRWNGDEGAEGAPGDLFAIT